MVDYFEKIYNDKKLKEFYRNSSFLDIDKSLNESENNLSLEDIKDMISKLDLEHLEHLELLDEMLRLTRKERKEIFDKYDIKIGKNE